MGFPSKTRHSVGSPPSCPVNPFEAGFFFAKDFDRHALGGKWFCWLTLAFTNEDFRFG